MLTTLIIKDFAIISRLELSFEDGMSVLSGETGAGKSIIINALGLLLGGRASTDIIRTGAEEAVVEGMFTVDHSHSPAIAKLESIGIDVGDDEFVVRRIVPRKGRGRIYIGGTLQSVTTLRELMRTVVDISGQHEHVSLLDESKHLSILDRYACIEDDVEQFSHRYSSYASLKRERDLLASSLEERAKRLDFINYQIDEISTANVQPGEADSITEKLKCLSNAETLQTAIDSAIIDLYDDENSVISRIGCHVNSLRRVSLGQKQISNAVNTLSEALSVIEDVVHDLRQIEIEESSPALIEKLQSRLSLIDKLERKYRERGDNLKDHLQMLESERQTLVLSDERISELESLMSSERSWLVMEAEKISKHRLLAAEKLSEEATNGLHLLAMENASIAIVCETTDKFEQIRATGADEVHFLLCPNPGESARPLCKIASGGELSRVLLALKRALVEKDDVACYVFDEVDTGIGGQTADHVAHMLKEVSRCHQVLCITHLASIASYADAQFRVSKSVVNDRTQSTIVKLSESERVEEIARMLGGTSITATSRERAAEMILQARESSIPKKS